MTMNGLVDCLEDIGPYNKPPTPDTEDDIPPSPREEDTKDDESGGENELRSSEDELEAEPIAEGDPGGEPSIEYELEEDQGVRNPQLSVNPKRTQ